MSAQPTAVSTADIIAAPPCPTCGGERCVIERQGHEGVPTMVSCPENGGNCDGKVSIEQLAERWRAVQSLSPGTRIQAVLDLERAPR